jgi:hypothetical protein
LVVILVSVPDSMFSTQISIFEERGDSRIASAMSWPFGEMRGLRNGCEL